MKIIFLNKKLIIAFILFCFASNVWSQKTVQGVIMDSQTSEGLPGVCVIIKGTNTGCISDINSKFVISSDKDIKQLEFSYMGYETIIVDIKDSNIVVRLDPSVFLMDQVIVTASRDLQKRSDAPVAMSIIPLKEVKLYKSESVSVLLSKVSGVHVADFGNEQQSISIRNPLSFSRPQIVVLEDGIPMAPTSISSSGSLKMVNLADIQSMEVLRGPSSSMYGSEAVGGVINFITQKPTLKPTLDIGYQGSQFGYNRGDLALSNTFGKVGVRANAYYAQRRNGYSENSDYSKLAINARIDYQVNSNTLWTTSIAYTDFNTDFSGSLDSAKFYDDDTYNKYEFCFEDMQALRVKSTLDHKWSDKSKSFVTLFFRDVQNEEIPTYRIGGVRNGPPYHGEFVKHGYQSYGAIAQHRLKFDFLNSKLIAGVSFDYSPNEYVSDSISVDNENGYYVDYAKTGTYIQNFNSKLFNSAAYLHYELEPVKRLIVQMALRYDQLYYEYDNNLPSSASSGAPDEKNDFSHLSPKAGMTYTFEKPVTVYANYSVGFAPPLFTQLYKQVKVPVLKPATFYSYEVGFWTKLLKNKAYFDLSLYNSDGINEIVEVLMEDGSTQNQSIGKTSHQGIEYTLTVKPIKSFEFRFAGSNSIHKYVDFVSDGVDYSGNEMSQAPNFIGNITATYHPNKFLKGFRIGGEWQYLSEYYIDQANTEKYDGYSIFNIRAGYKFKGVEIWLNVLNVADTKFASRVSKSTYATTYSPGFHRTFQFGINYHIEYKK